MCGCLFVCVLSVIVQFNFGKEGWRRRCVQFYLKFGIVSKHAEWKIDIFAKLKEKKVLNKNFDQQLDVKWLLRTDKQLINTGLNNPKETEHQNLPAMREKSI